MRKPELLSTKEPGQSFASCKKRGSHFLLFRPVGAPGKLLKPYFPKRRIGKFYNENFISVAVDGEKGEGIELARKYKIRGYPSLIFIDSNGKLIAQTAGYRNPKQLIELGEQVVAK